MTSAQKRKGLGSLSAERRKEIASQGGKAAHEKGVAHTFSSEEAEKAGRKGGNKVSKDRDHMREIGRRGGVSRGKQKSEAKKKKEAA